MAEGLTNAGIAKRLVLSERTVEAHVRSVLMKLSIPESDDAHRRVLAVLAHLTAAQAPVVALSENECLPRCDAARPSLGWQHGSQPTGGSMSTHAARPAVDVAPSAPARPGLALALALLSVPGVTITWDLDAVAGFAGTAVGIAAIVLGLQARSRLAGEKGTRMATVAVAVASLAVLSVVFFLIAGAPD